jgi:hypothetical protein
MNAVHNDLESVTSQGDSLGDTVPLQEFVPIGTFAGSEEFILRVSNGKPVAANTGDQGGGQN